MSYSPRKAACGQAFASRLDYPRHSEINSDAAKIGIIFHSRNFLGKFFCEVQENCVILQPHCLVKTPVGEGKIPGRHYILEKRHTMLCQLAD